MKRALKLVAKWAVLGPVVAPGFLVAALGAALFWVGDKALAPADAVEEFLDRGLGL